jgi:two-component system, sensor histidine kinase and response regulator
MQRAMILLVDDSPINLQVLGTILEGTYTTAVARDGAQALECIAQRRPDLILLDIMMPEMNGFEVCERLQAEPETRDIPVIFLTAKTETTDLVKGLRMGAVDYITKPFHKEELLARVSTHLALRQARQELQELNATKDRFFSIMAHDLRAPFNGLLGLTEVIMNNLDRYDPERLKYMLGLQLDAVNNVFALLENLLTWSRVQRGAFEFLPQRVSLDDLVNRNIALLLPASAQKAITVASHIDGALLVSADLNMLDTVVRNVLSNAVKFTPTGGSVTVSAVRRGDQVEVCVADTGIGIDADGLDKLFRIDAQYRRPGTANERGTGLGLILCKEFIERHGGAMWITSTVNAGANVFFTLPLESR